MSDNMKQVLLSWNAAMRNFWHKWLQPQTQSILQSMLQPSLSPRPKQPSGDRCQYHASPHMILKAIHTGVV